MEIRAFANRIKGVLIDPKTEFLKIKQENEIPKNTLLKFILPIVIIDAVISFIGEILFGPTAISNGSGIVLLNLVRIALVQIIAIYLSSYLINELLQLFHAKKNFSATFNLVSYSFLPIFVTNIATGLLPDFIDKFVYFFGFYSIIVFWIGTDIITSIAKEKKQIFIPISAIATGLIYMATWGILAAIFNITY